MLGTLKFTILTVYTLLLNHSFPNIIAEYFSPYTAQTASDIHWEADPSA